MMKTFIIAPLYGQKDTPPERVVAYGTVEGSTGNEYDVGRYADGSYFCGCKGKLFHREKDCKHIQEFIQVEKLQVEKLKPTIIFWKIEWCECKSPDGSNNVFFDDGVCTCGVSKHHYHCKLCGRLTQIG